MRTGYIPEQWKHSNIIVIFKKGDRHKIENYRPKSLSPTIAKKFSKLIEKRISPFVISQQPLEQAGFWKNFSTIDHLFIVNQIIEKCQEYQVELHMALIDYNKAFDSLKRDFMFKALKNQGVPDNFIEIIKEMYNGVKAKIISDMEGNYFEIKKGVKQGDALSPTLFNSALEEVFKKVKWEQKGININGKRITNLRFADDVALFANTQN